MGGNGQPRLLSRKAAAARCGVTVRTFDRWVRSGRLTAYRFGGRLRFAEEELGGVMVFNCAQGAAAGWVESGGLAAEQKRAALRRVLEPLVAELVQQALQRAGARAGQEERGE